MNVLFVARGYPSKKYKTNGIFEFDQAKALAKAGHKVIYIAVDTRSIRRWRRWGLERRNENGLYIYILNLPLGNLSRDLLNKISSYGLRYLYKKILKDHGKPDIIHAHFIRPAYSISLVEEVKGIPLVVTEHSSRIHKEHIGENYEKMGARAYKKANAVIAVSPSLVGLIEKNFKVKANYIPNVVDLGIFNYIDKVKKEEFVFVSTGNLIKVKGMELTIEAFYQAFGGNDHVRLHIFGQGVLRKDLEDLIQKYNMESQVKLMGFCSREEIADFYKGADCFLLASRSETFGVAYIEALAMGIPVIGTRSGGPEVFINEGNGILIEVDNKEQLVAAMKYMYEKSDLYKGKDISDEIIREYSEEAFVERIGQIYNETMAE